jgi:hypothetical protein
MGNCLAQSGQVLGISLTLNWQIIADFGYWLDQIKRFCQNVNIRRPHNGVRVKIALVPPGDSFSVILRPCKQSRSLWSRVRQQERRTRFHLPANM